jgi:hypothetical protein
MRLLIAVLAVVGMLVAGCASGGEDAAGDGAERSVGIVEPEGGGTVSAPVTLEVDVTGIEVGEMDHLHAYVDREAPPPGEPIPQEEEGVIHFRELTLTLDDLEPGEHTVIVEGADGSHVPFEPRVMDEVTFTLE